MTPPPPNTCTSPAPASATTATRPRRAAGSRRCRSSRRRQSGSTTPATAGTEARQLSAPAASAAKRSRPTPGATMTARGISPLAWYALRTAAATGTACISWPRAITATQPAAAGKTARPGARRGAAHQVVLAILCGSLGCCTTLRNARFGKLLQHISGGVVLVVAAALARVLAVQVGLCNTCCAIIAEFQAL